ETILEVPDLWIRDHHVQTKTEWTFENLNRAGAEEMLRESGLTEELIDLSNAADLWSETPLGVKLTPPDALIIGMTPKMRAALYQQLLNKPEGQLLDRTYGIDGGDFGAIAKDIPPEIVELVQKLSYKMSDLMEISDTPYLMSQIEDPIMRRRVIRALARTRSIVPRLRVDSSADIDALSAYWSGPRPLTSIHSLLASVRDSQQTDHIDLMYLLPPFPRKYLGTYTNFQDLLYTEQPDCFWTARNFFESEPIQRIHDNLPEEYYLEPEKFTKVANKAPFHFGDLFVVRDPRRDAFVHAYVHIADDLVFTKNGTSTLTPWIIMRRDDMLERYSHFKPFEVHVYRWNRPKTPGDGFLGS
ncbi:MAG: hypothetical protein AAF585_29445, partial [Verrucomicrobiota bacterium]